MPLPSSPTRRAQVPWYSISADALKNDDTYQRIIACTKFLNKMFPSGTYQDDYACH